MSPLSRWPRLRWALVGGYTVAGLTWLGWRAGWTLGGPSAAWSVAFLLAEAALFASSLAFDHLMACEPEGPDPAPPPLPAPLPSIDVLVVAYREPAALLRHTLRAARDLRLPHTTTLCDDGRRPELAALAAELGVSYLTRPDNQCFKAGNLNHALARTRGELVLVLDADHVAHPSMLERLVPHLADPDVAFVQVPQVYYNVGSAQHVAGPGSAWHESTLFHHRLQRGADALDAAVCVGTGALFRRVALHRVGGFATGSVVEDVHTSLRLHAAGYRSRYVHEALAVLLAPDTPLAYAGQRLRWTQGAMQMWRRESPLTVRGLDLRRRLAYASALGSFLLGWPTLALVLAPAAYVLLGWPPIVAEARVAVPLVAVHVGFDLLVFRLLAGRDGRLLAGERFRLINLAIWLRGSLRLLLPGGVVFRVTPKHRHQGLPAWVLAGPALVAAVNLATAAAAAWRLRSPGEEGPALAVALAFSAWFAVAGGAAALHLLRHRGGAPDPTWAVDGEVTLRRADGAVVVARARALGLATVELHDEPDGDAIVAVDLGGVGGPDGVPATRDGARRLRLGPDGPAADALGRRVFDELVPAWLAGVVDSAPPPPPAARPAIQGAAAATPEPR